MKAAVVRNISSKLSRVSDRHLTLSLPSVEEGRNLGKHNTFVAAYPSIQGHLYSVVSTHENHQGIRNFTTWMLGQSQTRLPDMTYLHAYFLSRLQHRSIGRDKYLYIIDK